MVQIHSEMDSIYLESFTTKKNMPESSKGLTRLVDPMNTLALQFPKAFSYEGYKTRCLRRAVMRLDWAQQPISQIATSSYTVIQFIMVLQEGLQLV